MEQTVDAYRESDDTERFEYGSVAIAQGQDAGVGRTSVTHLRSRFRRMYECDTAIVSQPLGELLTVLLQSAVLGVESGCEVLRPLWAEEAMHRSYNILKLVALLQRRIRRGRRDDVTHHIERSIAVHLAALYRSLVTGSDRNIVFCSAVLRGVVSDLVALFGSVSGDVKLRTNIEHIALPEFQRRALVLAASELVMNALLHAFKGRGHGRLQVELCLVDSRTARLTVTDDGVGCRIDPVEAERGVAGSLAGLLGSSLAYRPCLRNGTTAEITFGLTT
jgi:two-component sensor histidine kinase